MARVILRRYRALRPIFLCGRVLSTLEIVTLPEDEGDALVDTGHLKRLPDPVNGSAWCDPIER